MKEENSDLKHLNKSFENIAKTMDKAIKNENNSPMRKWNIVFFVGLLLFFIGCILTLKDVIFAILFSIGFLYLFFIKKKILGSIFISMTFLTVLFDIFFSKRIDFSFNFAM